MEEWAKVRRPGFLGKKRERIESEWDSEYGKGRWALAWEISGRLYPFGIACALYEDAYYAHFSGYGLSVLTKLCAKASDVYDNDITNIRSGFDYNVQETVKGMHIQDITVRRVLARLGMGFAGKDVVQVRSNNELGGKFSPGVVPFHMPKVILRPPLEGWWESGSVEEFYQSNRWLLIKPLKSSKGRVYRVEGGVM